MAIKIYNPTSPGRRDASTLANEEITKRTPEKSLVLYKKKRAGRNNEGKVTVHHQGGGVKQLLRIIDFKRDKLGIPGKVFAIEYDPGRSANIALIYYTDGEKRYIVAPVGLKVGDAIVSGETAEIKVGNTLPMKAIPTGTMIHNIELIKGMGGKLVRSAGGAAQLLAKEGDEVHIRLPSGEMRLVKAKCTATIGQVGNVEAQGVHIGKAGRKRLMGWRPTVRGSAMSPRDHPHGGGEGRTPIGMPGPKTPWGKPAMGYRTRKTKYSDGMIIRRRGKK